MTHPTQLRLGSSLEDFMQIVQLDLSNDKDMDLYRIMMVSRQYLHSSRPHQDLAID